MSAKLDYWNSFVDDFSSVSCTLYGGGIAIDHSVATSGGSAPLLGTWTDLTLTGVLDNGGYASLICTGNDGYVSDLVVTVTKVTNITHVS